MIIGSEEINKGLIKPRAGWKKYRYTCLFTRPGSSEIEESTSYVYCESRDTFPKLIAKWNHSVSTKRLYKYTYTEVDALGEPIDLRDIPADQNFKVKVLLSHESKNFIQ